MSPRSRDGLRGYTIAVPRWAYDLRVFGAGVGTVLGIVLLAADGEAILHARHAIIGAPEASSAIVAACIILLSLAALTTSQSSLSQRVAAQSAMGLALALILAGAENLQVALWPSSSEGLATTSLFLLAAGEWLLQYRLAKAGQVLVAAAAGGFLLAQLGYAAMLPPFHHVTALFEGLAGTAAVLSVITASIDSGFLQHLAADHADARLIRRALAVLTPGILLIGGLLASFRGSGEGISLLGETMLVLAWIWGAAVVLARSLDIRDGERHRMEKRLLRDARTDSLTGLLNRNQMDEMIGERRRAPEDAAIIMIDIDRFRSVNNALGTEAGDGLLVQAAKRLSNLAEPHRVARAGGDDFAILCNGIGPAVANRLAQAVVEIMAVPFRMADGRPFHVTASVGVAHGPIEGIKEMRHAACEARHIAKSQGGNQSVPFVSAMHRARIERIGLEQDLHRAFKSSSELFLVYQPIISLRDRRIVAVEALARWQHPESGLVPPGRFVDIAESSGMFLGLGCKLRELAVAQAARWRDTVSGQLPVINLNVSPLELARSDVPGSLGALIDRHGLQRSGFCLEVTEGSFADERALRSLRLARDAGFKIAMDDFGVGYSSLTQLPRLPLTSVKLDRSFLDQAKESEKGISLLATMVQLAHVLKLPVVAEGVESRRELTIVSECGCDSVQGFLFSEPLTPQQLEPWLRPDHKAETPAQAH